MTEIDDAPAERYAAALAEAVSSAFPIPPASAHALRPQLTAGQRRLFDAEWDRLRRFMDARDDANGPDPARILAAVVLLDDMAAQAPTLDDTLRERDARALRLPNLVEGQPVTWTTV